MNNVKVYFQNLSKWTYIRVGGLYLGCSLAFIFGWRILSGGGGGGHVNGILRYLFMYSQVLCVRICLTLQRYYNLFKYL